MNQILHSAKAWNLNFCVVPLKCDFKKLTALKKTNKSQTKFDTYSLHTDIFEL